MLRVGLLTVSLAASSLSASTRTQRPPGASSGSLGLIGGVIVDASSNAPVPAAVVTLTPAGQSAYQAGVRVLTDTSGRFFFASVKVGEYTLTSAKPGWLEGAFGRHRAGGSSVPLAIGDGDRRAGITIEMWKPAVIGGRVTDESGDPLVGVAVRVFLQHYAAGRRQFSFKARAITDDRGVYRFFDLTPGDYVVVIPAAVTAEPAAFRLQTETPRAYLQTMTATGAAPLSLEPATGVSGTNGPLISSALAMPQMPASGGAWATYATTIFPSATKLDDAMVIRATSGSERVGVDITVRMTPTYQVSGVLTSPEAVPPGFHAVHLLPADAADHPLFDVATAVTNAAGAFTFYGVPPGQYVARVVRTPLPGGRWRLAQCGGTGAIPFVCVTSGGPDPPVVSSDPLMFAEQRVEVADDHVRDLTMSLRSGYRLTGRVEFEGPAPRPTEEQLASIRVRLERADGQTADPAGGFDPTQPGLVSPDGTFATPSTMPGRYLVRAANLPKGWRFKDAVYEGRDVSETAFVLNGDVSGVTLTLTDRSTKVDGTISQSNGQADERAQVLMFPVNPGAWVDYGRTTRRVLSTASAAGKFSFPAPPSGEYFLIAIPPDLNEDWQDPAFLAKAASLADRVSVSDRQSLTHPLQVRRIQ